MKLAYINCYNCNEKEYENYDTENGYQYVKCVNCGLIYLNPRPSDEDIKASHEIGLHRGASNLNVTGRYSTKKISRYLKILKYFYSDKDFQSKNQKWLDIGCGFGEFIEALKIKGGKNISIKGSEPNIYKVESCISRGLDVEFIDLDNHNEKYDSIALLNVYSHLPDPIAFIKYLKPFLNRGGELFLQTGSTCHLPAILHHKPYYAPDHLSFANKEIVESILKRNGFKIINTKCFKNEKYFRITDIKKLFYKDLKQIINKQEGRYSLFPKNSNKETDMFIRARLED